MRGPWMIHPEHAAIMMPVLKGIISGNILEKEEDPEKPHRILCADFKAGESVSAGRPGASVYVTYLCGSMMKHDNYCGDPGTRTIGRQLLEQDADPDVIGHIIIADSGGGTAESVAELSSAIEKCEKPVVALVDGMAASACIYAISYCDRILAHEAMDRVGCIGTCINVSGWPKFRKDSDGYVSARIYADPSAEKNADYEAALEGDLHLIREHTLNPLAEQFMADMRLNRPGTPDEQLTGRTYFARDVVGTLIDGIGSFEDAVAEVVALAARTENENNPNQSTMKNRILYPALLAIASMADQVFDEDGSTHLQPSQLEEIESALAAARAQGDNQSVIDELRNSVSERDATIAARDARIAELEASLASAIELATGDQPENVAVDHAPEAAAHSDIKPAETFEEAMEACRDFLKKTV